ncbi:hypothetical protein DICPUDRAFT_15574, partial [Dictyostelium purpureum]
MATPVSLNQVEKKTIESILTNKREEGKLITKVSILNEKKKKTEIKTLILGTNRIFLFSDLKGKLSAEYHYLDVNVIESSSENDVTIKFRNQTIFKMSNLDAGEILKTMYITLISTFPGIKLGKTVLLQVTPESRLPSIFAAASASSFNNSQCGSFSLTYRSVCDYLGLQPLSSVLWDIENLYQANQVKDFNLAEIYQFTPNDLKALLLSLSYNTYFQSFISNYKLLNEDLIQLAEVFKENTSLQQISITNSQCSKEPFISLLTNIAENKGLFVSSINLSNNQLENKGILTLGSSIQTFSKNLNYLNIENTSCSGKGIEAFFGCLAANSVICSSLSYLNINNNKLESYGTNGLCKFLSKAKALQQLHMSNTSPVYSLLKMSSPAILQLDFSGNRPTTSKETVMDILAFFKQMPSLQTVNLARIQPSTDELKLLFSPATNLIKCQNVDLSENELGDNGITKLCEIMYPNSNIRHLAIDGNFKSRSKLRGRAIEAIINLIEDNNSIESLSISTGNTKYQLKGDLMPLLLSLLKNQSLIKLDISGNGVGDSGALAISKILWKNQTLKSLKCEGNDFSYTALKMIKNSIKRNEKSLTFFPLPITDIAAILKNDGGSSIVQDKVIKTIQDLQCSIVNNYPNNISSDASSNESPNSGSAPATKPPSQGSIKKPPTGPPTTKPSSTTNITNGYTTLPIKRPGTRGPLYPGRVINSSASGEKSASAASQVEIPPLVSRSIDLLIDEGTNSVGIFRTCASATALKKIKSRFEAGEDIDLKAENVDVDTVAGVLKSYFREMASPIFPENIHESFFQASRQSTIEDKILAYHDIVEKMPPLESKMIKKLFHLLHLISLEKDVNMMSPENIAICWAPTLFRSFASELLPINSFMIVFYFDIFDPENKPISPESKAENGSPPINGANTNINNSLASPLSPVTSPTKDGSPTPTTPSKSHTIGPLRRPLSSSTGMSLIDKEPSAQQHNTMPSSTKPPSTGVTRKGSSGLPPLPTSLSATNTNSNTSSSSSGASSLRSSNGINTSPNSSPTPTPPDSPSFSRIDGNATLRSKRFSRVNRGSYSPGLSRASRSISSLFQDSDLANNDTS